MASNTFIQLAVLGLAGFLVTMSLGDARAASDQGPSTGAAKKWEAPIPKVAENAEAWQKLIPALRDKGLNYGALAAARNMLNFFQDLPSKELAYTTIIQLVDSGYPFSTRPYFIPGDIEPHTDTDFGKNYFFYKALVNVDKKMTKWADSNFAKIEKETFPKWIFYQGLLAYGEGKLDEAAEQIKKALALTAGPEKSQLAEKEARTLARIYYEQEKYEKAFEIYDTFLLKLSPINPTDWLEAGWALYRMKKYPEVLGYLYNLESKAVGPTILLEKYILRSLIYREYCEVSSVARLEKTFNKDFGKILARIRLGEAITPEPILVKIEHPKTVEYRQAIQSIEQLTNEKKGIEKLPADLRPLASYLYDSEIKMLARRKQMKENEALQVLSQHLLILAESLKFLKFDVARERFNPEAVFSEEVTTEDPLVETTDEKTFRLRWKQSGDFWRDERQSYRAKIKAKCD
jgi:tetratricopeptide (TPR) repeat protein